MQRSLEITKKVADLLEELNGYDDVTATFYGVLDENYYMYGSWGGEAIALCEGLVQMINNLSEAGNVDKRVILGYITERIEGASDNELCKENEAEERDGNQKSSDEGSNKGLSGREESQGTFRNKHD